MDNAHDVTLRHGYQLEALHPVTGTYAPVANAPVFEGMGPAIAYGVTVLLLDTLGIEWRAAPLLLRSVASR